MGAHPQHNLRRRVNGRPDGQRCHSPPCPIPPGRQERQQGHCRTSHAERYEFRPVGRTQEARQTYWRARPWQIPRRTRPSTKSVVLTTIPTMTPLTLELRRRLPPRPKPGVQKEPASARKSPRCRNGWPPATPCPCLLTLRCASNSPTGFNEKQAELNLAAPQAHYNRTVRIHGRRLKAHGRSVDRPSNPPPTATWNSSKRSTRPPS